MADFSSHAGVAMVAGGSGGIGKPGEVARAVVFLLSRDASYITGQSIAVDGGMQL